MKRRRRRSFTMLLGKPWIERDQVPISDEEAVLILILGKNLNEREEEEEVLEQKRQEVKIFHD
jgi:hypothetical protein